LSHKTKEILIEVKNAFLPLVPHSDNLLIETMGGNVISTMNLRDFLCLIDVGKRIDITERYSNEEKKEYRKLTVDDEINDILTSLER